MDENHSHTWLDLAARDHLIDTQLVAADNYDDFQRFLRGLNEGNEPPKDIGRKD